MHNKLKICENSIRSTIYIFLFAIFSSFFLFSSCLCVKKKFKEEKGERYLQLIHDGTWLFKVHVYYRLAEQNASSNHILIMFYHYF